jgi:hypothetical protein
MNSYTIIEDIFEDDEMRIPTTTNQYSPPQPFLRQTHTPADMKEIRGHQERERGQIGERESVEYGNQINNIQDDELLDLRTQDSNQQCYQQQRDQREERQHERQRNERQRNESQRNYYQDEVIQRDTNKNNKNTTNISTSNRNDINNPSHIQCKDIFDHVDSCPMCTSYFKKDIKFYWLIIAILIGVIFMTIRNKK